MNGLKERYLWTTLIIILLGAVCACQSDGEILYYAAEKNGQ